MPGEGMSISVGQYLESFKEHSYRGNFPPSRLV